MTAELDLSVFKAAAEELKGDEFIVDKKRFSMDATLHALHVGGARLDAHLIAGGIHSFRDLESHGIPVPDEGATVQEVGEIQGHLFDCLVTRLNGHSAFLSTGVSAYVHRGFEFKMSFCGSSSCATCRSSMPWRSLRERSGSCTPRCGPWIMGTRASTSCMRLTWSSFGRS